jgi:hypothetical protein
MSRPLSYPLQADSTDPEETLDDLRRVLDRMRSAQRVHVAAMLLRYGASHTGDCQRNNRGGWIGPPPCTCGLTNLLRSAR